MSQQEGHEYDDVEIYGAGPLPTSPRLGTQGRWPVPGGHPAQVVPYDGPAPVGERVGDGVPGGGLPYNPAAQNDANERLQRMLLDCIGACENVQGPARAISLDAQDVCRLTLATLSRESRFRREVLDLCARVCEMTSAQCGHYDDPDCRTCAQTCKQCAEGCRRSIG